MNRNSIPLNALVKMWPTPSICGNYNRKGASATSGDGLDTAVRNWRTPSATEADHGGPNARDSKGGLHLSAQVRQYPSPVASGKLNGGTRDFRKLRDLMDAGEITDAERRSMSAGNGGQLNPSWVCWLMGWPIGWTSLDPLNDILWLDWSVDPGRTGTGPIPRVATGIKDRVNRLKALGNGQVPLCAAAAFRILSGAMTP